MGSGGARVGSGKKPLEALKFTPREECDDPDGLLEPPDDLPESQREFWITNAPLAIEKRTLTRHFVTDFKVLCNVEEQMRGLLNDIHLHGRVGIKLTVDGSGQQHMEIKVAEAVRAYLNYAKAVDGMLGKFGLAPFGKPSEGAAKKVAANPWEAVVKR